MTLTTLRLSDPYGLVGLRSNGTGEPLVLIHGVGMQSAAWGPQIDSLSNTHRVLAVDMPGHGESEPLGSDAQLSDFVAWFRAALTALDLGPVNVAGHSMGALIALGIAATSPDMIRRVALLNSVYRRTDAARTAVEQRAQEIKQGHYDLTAPLDRWFGDTLDEQARRADVAGWLSAVDPRGYATAYAAFAKGDATYADDIAQLYMPLLALTGSQDPNSTPEMSRAMAQTARHARVIVLDGHRHMANLTAAQEVNRHLSDWLAMPEHKKDE